jgi:tRNA(fMet)-specific endonuclease VapC
VYCFDTDVISSLIRSDPATVLVRRLAGIPVEQQHTTAITAGELLYGAMRRGSDRLREAVEAILASAITVLPFDTVASAEYARVRTELETAGRRLADPDLRIAAIARAHDITLVTGNTRHFRRVPGLRVENWLEPGG